MAWKVKPTKSDASFSKEAKDILRKLELANLYNNKRAYNKVLRQLKNKYPDKADLIDSHIKSRPKKNLLKEAMDLTPEEKQWIASWKYIRN